MRCGEEEEVERQSQARRVQSYQGATAWLAVGKGMGTGTGELEELRCRRAVMSVESLAEAEPKLPRQQPQVQVRVQVRGQAVALAVFQRWVELVLGALAAMMQRTGNLDLQLGPGRQWLLRTRCC